MHLDVHWMVKLWANLSIQVIALKHPYLFQHINSHTRHLSTMNVIFDCVHFKILNVNR